jgi:hypothetical protein
MWKPNTTSIDKLTKRFIYCTRIASSQKRQICSCINLVEGYEVSLGESYQDETLKYEPSSPTTNISRMCTKWLICRQVGIQAHHPT